MLSDGHENGDKLKEFNTRDGMGFQLLREAIKTGIIASEGTKMIENKKLKVDSLYQGKRDGGKLTGAKKSVTSCTSC